MKKVIIVSILLLSVTAGLLLTSCKKEPGKLSAYQTLGNTKKDTLRIYNLLPDISGDGQASGYLVYVNDSVQMYQGMGSQYTATFAATPFVVLPATGGSINVKLVRYRYNTDTPAVTHPPAANIVIEKTLEVPPHSGYGDLFFYDDGGHAAVKYLPITSADPGAPAPGRFKIRVINFSYAMADYSPSFPENSAGDKYALSLQTPDSVDVPGLSNVAFASVSDYKEFDYGSLEFLVHNNTQQNYLNNCGVLDDGLKTFDLYPISGDPSYPYNRIFPSINPPTYGDVSRSLQVMNVGSYPFAAGNCYSVLVIGRIYAVLTDRRYGDGVLDNFGQVQVVNTNPNQQKVDVHVAYPGGEMDYPALAFGKYTEPLMVPAGAVTVTFSSQGKMGLTYSGQVTRLANFSWYYLSDLNSLPFVLPISNTITAQDYIPAGFYDPAYIMLSKMGVINLSPDAGNIFFTHNTYLVPTAENTFGGEVSYKNHAGGASYDGTLPPVLITARLSTSRKDSLAAKAVATMTHPFPTFPAPGTYTLVAAGLLNTTDTAKGIHLFMIKHTNFIPKAK